MLKFLMKQIFLASSTNTVIADIVKKLPNSPAFYNLAFISTAAEIYQGDHPWVTSDKIALEKFGFKLEEFSITGMSPNELEEKLKDKNGIFMSGGNQFYLLDQVIKTGFDQILKRKIEEGILYLGSSAGSMIMGTNIHLSTRMEDRSVAPDLKSDGLGLVDLAILPHWGSDDLRDEYSQGFETMYVENIKILPLSDKQYIHIIDNNYKIVQI